MNDNKCGLYEDLKLLFEQLKFTVSKCSWKLKLTPRRKKHCIAFSMVLFFILCLHHTSWIFPDPVSNYEGLVESSKCPACYGSRVCGLFHYGQITMNGPSKFRVLDYYNVKNVHFAKLKQGDVVVKKMALDSQFVDVDNGICLDAGESEGCDVAHAFPVLPFNTKPLTPSTLKIKNQKNIFFSCPTQRLIDKIWTNFQEYDQRDKLTMSDKLKVLYTLKINPEPLILQTFPKSEGWPFPEYIGACGRTVVLEHCGEELGAFYQAEFSVRVMLAYELMMIAETLTSKFDFALYLTDLEFSDFAVDFTGKVTIVDLERITVVDKLDVKARAPEGWKNPHQAKFEICVKNKNCMEFDTEAVCSHEWSDHNYYIMCRRILSQYSNNPKYPRGLLHSIPLQVSSAWDLEYHLNMCANPRPPANRLNSKAKLVQALKSLKEEFKKREDLFKDLVRKRL